MRCINPCKPLHLPTYVNQAQAIQLTLNVSFATETPARVGFKPTIYWLKEDAPPTELCKQLGWLGQIEALQGNACAHYAGTVE